MASWEMAEKMEVSSLENHLSIAMFSLQHLITGGYSSDKYAFIISGNSTLNEAFDSWSIRIDACGYGNYTRNGQR